MKLRKALEVHKELYSRFITIEQQARSLLEFSQAGAYGTYTPHGLSHISAVEKNYDWLISDSDLNNSFNALEIFCLLCATYFHDAFMIPQKLGTEEYTRANHARRAQQILTDNRDKLQLSYPEARIIALIILGHGDYQALSSDILVLRDTPIEIRKLAACLSMADICHADASRAPQIVFDYLHLEGISLSHWERHLQISGIARNGNELLMSAFYLSDEGHEAIKLYKKLIEEQLLLVRPYFDSKLQPLTSVTLDAKSIDETGMELQFEANTEAIVNMLIEAVYHREDAFVRELVQNALDACTLAGIRAKKNNKKYKPAISICLLREKDKVVAIRFDDNGVGMSAFDIRDTVMLIGSSISHKRDVKQLLQEAKKKNLIAKFGIGLLSCFKVAKSIRITTRKEHERAIQFDLITTRDRVNFQNASDNSIGTTIVIDLKDSVVDELRIEDAISHYIKMLPHVDLRVHSLPYTSTSLSLTREEVFETKTPQIRLQGEALIEKLKDQVAFCEIAGEDYHGYFAISLQNRSAARMPDVGKITILNEGLFVSTDEATEWFPESLKIVDGVINFFAGAMDLPVSRDKIISNKKNNLKKTTIALELMETIIPKLIRRMIANNAASDDPCILILSFMYKKANNEIWQTLFRHLGDYPVCVYPAGKPVPLGQVARDRRSNIYIEYNQGRWVTDLNSFKGKQLFHKPDEITKMQAAYFRQKGELVISASRFDFNTLADSILEADMLKAYLKRNNKNVVDLRSENVLTEVLAHRVLHEEVTRILGKNIKFCNLDSSRNERGWVTGSEVWLNIAHPEVKLLFRRLYADKPSENFIRLAKALVNIWVCRFDDGMDELYNLIKSFPSPDKM